MPFLCFKTVYPSHNLTSQYGDGVTLLESAHSNIFSPVRDFQIRDGRLVE